ncbi:MAG: hypothetical protein Kow0079_03470 [Vicingaceae bacterium]
MKLIHKLGFAIIALFLLACEVNDDYIPKPKGYFYIHFPKKKYQKITLDCPYEFEIPTYSKIEVPDKNNPCWINVVFPDLNATIYFSYKPIINNFDTLLEDSRSLAYKHTIKAVDIQQEAFLNPENKVSGLTYFIKGNTASKIQFHITDSTHHFLRGSLYFNSLPNQDSIKPVLDFINEDIDHICNTLKWK